jgi:hypothetical protein
LLAADRPAGWRVRPAEAKGHAGDNPDELVLLAAASPGNLPIGNRRRRPGVIGSWRG